MCWNFSYESFVNTKILHFSWLTSDMNVEAVTYNHAIINAILIDNPFVLLTQYCAGDKIEKNEMGWACGAYG